jgi:small multidrug resistance family-3 protein
MVTHSGGIKSHSLCLASDTASSRRRAYYAANGGVYIAVALVWLWKVDGVPLTAWDLTGAAVALIGMGIIVWGGWRA